MPSKESPAETPKATTSDTLPVRRILIAVAFGLAGFGVNFLDIQLFKSPTFKISILLGLFFPLLIALAWGWRYGLLSALAGGCQTMWWLWQGDGWGILYSVPIFTVWVLWHGWWADRRRTHAHSAWWRSAFVIELPFRLISELGFYTLFRWLVSLNPPPWNPTLIWDQVTLNWVSTVAIKHTITAYVLLLTAYVALSLGPVRRFLHLPRRSGERDTNVIYAIAVLMSLSFLVVTATVEYLAFNSQQDTWLQLIALDVAPFTMFTRVLYVLSLLAGALVIARLVDRRAYLRARLNHLNRVLLAIRNVNQLITRRPERKALLQGVCASLTETRGYYNAWIALFDDAGELVATAESGVGDAMPALIARLGEGDLPQRARRALAQDDVVIAHDPADLCKDCPMATMYAGNGVMVTRLAHEEQVYGVLAASMPPHFVDNEDEQNLFRDIAGDVALALHGIALAAEHERAEADLQRERDLLDLITETSPVGITVLNAEGEITFANLHAEKTLSLTLDDITERAYNAPQWQITDEEGLPFPDAELPFRQVMKTEQPVYDVRHAITQANDRRVFLSINAAPLFDDSGEINGVISTIEDITERKRAEDALRESERRYQALFDHSNDAVFILDMQGNHLDLNQRAAEMLGYTKPKLLSLSIEDLVIPKEYPDAMNKLAVLKAGEKLPIYERTFRKQDGTLMPGEINVNIVRNDRGDPLQIQSIIRDITSRKRAEEALRESERQKQIILNATTEMVAYYDLDLNIIWANQAAAASVNKTVEELIGLTCYEVWHQRDEPCEGCPVLKARETKAPQQSEQQTPDDRVWFLRGYPVFDDDGAVTALVEFGLDITQQKQLESSLQESEARLRTIVENAPLALFAMDGEGRVIFAEGQGLYSGYADSAWSVEQLWGKTADEIFTDLPESVLHDIQRALNGDTVTSVAEAGGVTLEVTYGPYVGPSGEVEGVIGVAMDITERKTMEEQLRHQEQLAAVGQLAGGIAHDFNNILASILLYAQLSQQNKQLPPGVETALGTIVKESHRAADLVSQILDFSRRAMIETRPLELVAFVQEIMGIFRRTIPENLRMILDLGISACTIEADPTRIQQALLNLVANARDAMPEGGEIQIGVHRVKIAPDGVTPVVDMPPGTWACLTVTDTGEGMTEDVQAHLFEPFFTTKPPGEGTGLGLAQVHGIVKQHHGYIDVDSAPGEGTTFWLYFPCNVRSEAESPAETSDSLLAGSGESILVVEDASHLREIMAEFLTSLGYTVLKANNGQEALELMREVNIDMLISDVVMPELSGDALLRTIRKEYPTLPALAITGYVMDADIDALHAAGFARVLTKPFDMEQLASAVSQVLSTDDRG